MPSNKQKAKERKKSTGIVTSTTKLTPNKGTLHNIFMVNRRLDFLFFLSAQLFRASLLSFLYRSLRSLSVDLKVSFTAPSGILYLQSLRTTVHSFSSFKSFTHSLSLLRDYVSQSFTYRSALTSLTLGYSLSFVTSLSIARPKGLALIYRS